MNVVSNVYKFTNAICHTHLTHNWIFFSVVYLTLALNRMGTIIEDFNTCTSLMCINRHHKIKNLILIFHLNIGRTPSSTSSSSLNMILNICLRLSTITTKNYEKY